MELMLVEVLNLDAKWILMTQHKSIEIDQLGYTAELERRTETSLENSGATNGGLLHLALPKGGQLSPIHFFTGQSGTSIAANSVLPSIGITIENAQSGDFFELSNITGTGFNIHIKNGQMHVDQEISNIVQQDLDEVVKKLTIKIYLEKKLV